MCGVLMKLEKCFYYFSYITLAYSIVLSTQNEIKFKNRACISLFPYVTKKKTSSNRLK